MNEELLIGLYFSSNKDLTFFYRFSGGALIRHKKVPKKE